MREIAPSFRIPAPYAPAGSLKRREQRCSAGLGKSGKERGHRTLQQPRGGYASASKRPRPWVNKGRRKGQRAAMPRSSVGALVPPHSWVTSFLCQLLVGIGVVGGLGMLLFLLFLRPLL